MKYLTSWLFAALLAALVLSAGIAAQDKDKKDEPKKDEPKKDEPKKDEPKKDELKKDEPKKDEPKKDEPKKDEPKKDEPKKDEPKKDEPKKDEPKKDEPKKDEPKKDEPKKDEPKKDAPKKDEPPAPTSDFKTPKEALIAATDGLLEGDEKKFASAVAINAKEEKDQAKQKELVKALVRFVTAAQKFKTAFVAQYKDAGWDRFNDPKVDPGNGEGNASLRLQTKAEAMAAVNAAKFDEKGEVATCEIEQKSGKKKTWKFVKVKDGWLVSVETFTDGSADIDKTIKVLNGYADLLPKYQRAIGKEGVTADDIDVELGKAFVKQIYGLETKPPRFDVNKFQN